MKEEVFRTHYPDYNVLDKWSSPDWDDQTREIVRQRLEEVPPIRFFTNAEAQMLGAVAERIIPQPDRSEIEKIPIVPWIDQKLFEDKRDGYRYEEMPRQREAWRLGIAGINQTAEVLFDGQPFVDLDRLSQEFGSRNCRRSLAADEEPGEATRDGAGSTWIASLSRHLFSPRE